MNVTTLIKEHSALPVCVGFGIFSAEQLAEITDYTDGAIVGNTFVKIIDEHGKDAKAPFMRFIREFKTALA